MRVLSRPRARRLLAGALLLMLCAAVGWLIWPATSWARDSEREQAERRWALRPFGSYHLDITDKRCLQQIEVRNERVARVAPNRCDAPPRTVSDLFALIQRDGSVSHACILQGCACDDIIRVQASYDPTLGYPARMIVRIRAEPNWRAPAFWQRAWADGRLPRCDGLAEASKIIEVLQITPRQP